MAKRESSTTAAPRSVLQAKLCKQNYIECNVWRTKRSVNWYDIVEVPVTAGEVESSDDSVVISMYNRPAFCLFSVACFSLFDALKLWFYRILRPYSVFRYFSCICTGKEC